MFQRKHEMLLRNVVLFMGHVVRSVVQGSMQDATLDNLSENTRPIVVDWAMQGASRKENRLLQMEGNTNGMVQLLQEEKQTVTGVIGQLDNAGCYHSFNLMLTLGLAGGGQVLVIVLKWIFQ